MRTVRVLVADDHEVVRKGLVSLLDGVPGMEVVAEAEDGGTVCRLATEHAPDVIVVDLSMPRLGGIDVIERLGHEYPSASVLVLTIHDDRGYLTRALEEGASGYVLKRSAADELVRAVRVVADGGTWVDPVLAGHVLRRGVGPRVVASGSPEVLSPREEEVLRLIARGFTNKEIGEQLGISTRTVETYRSRIGSKLDLRSRAEIVRYALQQGWLSAD